MNKFLLLLILALCFEVHANPFINRSVNVLFRGSELIAPFASSISERSAGKICSRLYGLTKETHNKIVAACKVCYIDKFTDENWPDESTVRTYQLRKNDEIIIKAVYDGGSNHISEAYGCSYDDARKPQCHGDNLALQGIVTRTQKKLEILCTSDEEINRNTLNLIFKDVLDFRSELYKAK